MNEIHYNGITYKYNKVANIRTVYTEKSALDEIKQLPEVIQITNHTVNTWQPDRSYDEILTDTAQGKLVESMFMAVVSSNSDLEYVSYDAMRTDNWEKHAPFDGLLFKKNNVYFQEGIRLIGIDVNGNAYGKISADTIKWLTDHRLYTVEVKSSRVPDRDYPNRPIEEFNSNPYQEELIRNLMNRDLFVYPKYTRSAGRTIHSFQQYVAYVKNKISFINEMGPDAVNYILNQERIEKCNIYTRIFVDKDSSNNIVAYLPGYVRKEQFFEAPQIINMSRRNKSEGALNYVFPFEKAKRVQELSSDSVLWGKE